MKVLLPVVSCVGLALVIGPSLFYLAGAVDKSAMTTVMLVGTLVWFGSVPFWMERRHSDSGRSGSLRQ